MLIMAYFQRSPVCPCRPGYSSAKKFDVEFKRAENFSIKSTWTVWTSWTNASTSIF